jgi:single-stranded DNA-binding protein
MQQFNNHVNLCGILGNDAEVPTARIEMDSYAVLLLATVSGMWDLYTNNWTSRTDWHQVICPGPYFCGLTRGMKRGDYLEIEGELRGREQERVVVVESEPFPVRKTTYAVHAIRIRQLDRPDWLVDTCDED